MAPLKVYVASITANPEIRKRVQRTLMLLDGLGIPFDAIDITKPGNEEHRIFMRQNAIREGEKPPYLPPQFFHNEEYLGNYVDFEESVEDDRITEFLRLTPNSKPPEPEDQDTYAGDSDKENNGKGGKSTSEEEGAEKAEEDEGEDEEWDEGEGEDEEEEEGEEEGEGTVQQTIVLGQKADQQAAPVKETSAEVEETAVIRLGGSRNEEEDEEEEEDECEGEDEEWDEEEEEEEEEEEH